MIPGVRFFLLLLISGVRFYFCWFMPKIFKLETKMQNWTCYYSSLTKNKSTPTTTMRQSSMEQDFASISSLHGIWFCLAKSRLLIYQKTSDYLAVSYQIFTAGLLELQRLDKIKFYVALYKIYIAHTRLLRRKKLSVFWCKIFTFIKAICNLHITK